MIAKIHCDRMSLIALVSYRLPQQLLVRHLSALQGHCAFATAPLNLRLGPAATSMHILQLELWRRTIGCTCYAQPAAVGT